MLRSIAGILLTSLFYVAYSQCSVTRIDSKGIQHDEQIGEYFSKLYNDSTFCTYYSCVDTNTISVTKSSTEACILYGSSNYQLHDKTTSNGDLFSISCTQGCVSDGIWSDSFGDIGYSVNDPYSRGTCDIIQTDSTSAYLNGICIIYDNDKILGIQPSFTDNSYQGWTGSPFVEDDNTKDCYFVDENQCFSSVTIWYIQNQFFQLEFETSDDKLTPAWGSTSSYWPMNSSVVSVESDDYISCISKMRICYEAGDLLSGLHEIQFYFIPKITGITTTMTPTESADFTPAPTRSFIDSECVCHAYTADNASLVLPSGDGCTYGCNSCAYNVCFCEDKETCDAWKEVVNGLSKIFIILIVVGSICVLCCIGGVVYCICAGAVCCAQLSKSNKQQGVSFIATGNDGNVQTNTQMV